MTLDSDGWLPIDELIVKANLAGKKLDRELLLEIVRTNDKQRFVICNDGQKIRASQGHSIRDVDLRLQAAIPPAELYHGTIKKFLPSILSSGLSKQARNHVHLSADRETAETVGLRRGVPVILVIDSSRMHEDGVPFFQSDNGVWLTESVPKAYLTISHRR